MILPISFYSRNTTRIAKSLLGCFLVHKTKEGITIGKIVETEAYLSDDPASHSFNGKTKRNEAMFGSPGRAYVYFTYGMYHCFNIVTRKEGIGEAVLIRALEPISGIALMKKRRKTADIHSLCNGPAKLVIAMGISEKQNKHDLSKSQLFITKLQNREKFNIVQAKRIGISKGKNLLNRFYIKGNEFVSRK